MQNVIAHLAATLFVGEMVQNSGMSETHPMLPHTVILERVCASLKISENMGRTLKKYETRNIPGKKMLSFHEVLLQHNISMAGEHRVMALLSLYVV